MLLGIEFIFILNLIVLFESSDEVLNDMVLLVKKFIIVGVVLMWNFVIVLCFVLFIFLVGVDLL